MNAPDPIRPATVSTAEADRFCTAFAQAAGTPLAGIGAHQERTLWLRWPKRLWRYSLRVAQGMEGAVETAIETVFADGRRVNLIDRKDGAEMVQALLYPEALKLDLAADALPAFLTALAEGTTLTSFAPAPMARPAVFVCTHGVHDRCCAKWGFAAYKALSRAAADRFDVWECTHLGGCRIAAGALVVHPDGRTRRKYGRITPIHAVPLLAAEAEGRPYLPCYRGASDLTPQAQAAEVAGLRALAKAGHWGVADVTPLGGPDHAPRFAVALEGAWAEVTLVQNTVADHGACTDLHAGNAPEPRTVWHASESRLMRLPPSAAT
ncbi:MAG: sucrase ferredoxin [Pseudomonadota bacterium]